MAEPLQFDCAALVRNAVGAGYAHEYDNYLNFFRMLGSSTDRVDCVNVPNCWAPFIMYLGHGVISVKPNWDVDQAVWATLYEVCKDRRRVVEITSACRPELVHALYCADTEWPCPRRLRSASPEFPVTCNGSFFRDEVLAYIKALDEFKPTRNRAVLVPCAAVKPYPAPLHAAVLARIDRDRWHVITATGVLGLVPEELWPVMPAYDSGLPNLFRCEEIVRWYFTRHRYAAVVCYSDFYAHAVHKGMQGINTLTNYVLGHHYRDTYENLLLPEHLRSLDNHVAELTAMLQRQKGMMT